MEVMVMTDEELTEAYQKGIHSKYSENHSSI